MRSRVVAPRALLRVEPLVRDAERVARVGRLVGQEHGAEGARDVEGLAVLGEGPDGGVDQRLLVALPDAHQHAELVAPEPVGRAAVARDERELRAEPDEERVPGRVPERVVVALEAVEVEDHQHRRRRPVRLERRVEVDQEPAPVPEAGERVGDGVVPREHVEPRVLPERQHQPDEHEGERERGKGDRGNVHLLEVVDDEDADRGRGAEERNGEERAALDVERALVPRAGPRGGGDEEGRERPQHVDRAARLVRVDLEQVDGVGDRGRQEAEREEEPAALEPPAGERDDPDDGREQEDVAERVGDVRRDRAPRALGTADHHLDQHGRAERRGGDGGRQPVEPERAGDEPRPLPQQQHDPDVEQRVEREPARVRERRVLDRIRDQEVELPERGAGEREGDEAPGQAIARDEQGPRGGDHHCDQEESVVEPDVDDPLHDGTGSGTRSPTK